MVRVNMQRDPTCTLTSRRHDVARLRRAPRTLQMVTLGLWLLALSCSPQSKETLLESSTTAGAQAFLSGQGGDDPRQVDGKATTTPALGDPNPLVVVTLWEDFECTFCRRHANLGRRLLEVFPSQVQVQFRALPLPGVRRPFHTRAKSAAYAAYAAHRQGRFEQYRTSLFESQDRWRRCRSPVEAYQHFIALAKTLGCDPVKFSQDLGRVEIRFELEHAANGAQLERLGSFELPLVTEQLAITAEIDALRQDAVAVVDSIAAILRTGSNPVLNRTTVRTLTPQEIIDRVDDDQAKALALGLERTPAALVNGQRVSAVAFDPIATLIRAELKLAQNHVDEGLSHHDAVARRHRQHLNKAERAAWLLDDAAGPAAESLRAQRSHVAEVLEAPLTEQPVWRVTVTPDDPVLGASDALITLVEFGDFQCPYCRRFKVTVDRLLKRFPKHLRVVYKHFPLSFHDQAQPAARAAVCAAEQGQFWAYHDALLASSAQVATGAFEPLARELGLDSDRFTRCLSSPQSAAKVSRDQTLGHQVGVSGTPSMYLNGHAVEGRMDFTELSALIEALEPSAKALAVKHGRGQALYEALISKGQVKP